MKTNGRFKFYMTLGLSILLCVQTIILVVLKPDLGATIWTLLTLIIGLAIAYIERAQEMALFMKREWLLISIIVVDKEHRKKGIGKNILEKLYKWGKTNGIDEVELTVFSFNEAAINFYEKNGFKDVKKKMYRKIN